MFVAIIGGIVIIAVLVIIFRQFFGKSLNLYEENKSNDENGTPEIQSEDEFQDTEITLNHSEILRPKNTATAKHPYNLQENLFSTAESRLFEALKEAFKGEYEIFAKVRAADVLYVDTDRRNFYVYFNRIARKRFDFVICSKEYAIVAAVELDNPENQENSKGAPEIRMDEICRIASLPLIKFVVKDDYLIEEIRGKLHDALEQADSVY